MAPRPSRPSIVDVSPFDNPVFGYWDTICLKGMRIFAYVFDSFLSCFISTTQELKTPQWRYLYIAVGIPVWLLLSVLALPIGTFFFLMWIPICQKRRPYRYSYVTNAERIRGERAKTTYTCSTLNVCLLYEFLTRFNNQSNTCCKAVNIGRNIAAQQLGDRGEYESMSSRGLTPDVVATARDEKLEAIDIFNTPRKETTQSTNNTLHHRQTNKPNTGSSEENTCEFNSHADGSHHAANRPKSGMTFDHAILTEFPPQDFLLLQETFDLASARALAEELHHVFPYIVYDARCDGYSSNLFCSNSGTMIASRYPILATRFDYYRDSLKQCRFASKGLLQVKVIGTRNCSVRAGRIPLLQRKWYDI